MRDMVRDFLGHSVIPGDYVFYSTTGRYIKSRVCRVTRITDAGSVFGEIIKSSAPVFEDTLGLEVNIKANFIRIPDLVQNNVPI